MLMTPGLDWSRGGGKRRHVGGWGKRWPRAGQRESLRWVEDGWLMLLPHFPEEGLPRGAVFCSAPRATSQIKLCEKSAGPGCPARRWLPFHPDAPLGSPTRYQLLN